MPPSTPDPIVKGYASTDSGQIHYRRVMGPGTPVILLHRTPTSSESFERMLRLLAGRRAAIAFDTPGFGQSFRPSGYPSTVDYARWFLAAIDALGIGEFHLCAHHTGTHFSVEMALLAPLRARSLMLNGVLYADAAERAAMRAAIGDAAPVDEAGTYLARTWSVIRGLYSSFDAEIIHREVLGALGAIEGRNQAFTAILNQDFRRALASVTCPVTIVQAVDDGLAPMLERVHADFPLIPIELLGPAETAAPERQPDPYAAALLRFADAHDRPHPRGPEMTDRQYRLIRTTTGFDLDHVMVERPEPGPGEVLVEIHAVSLNRRDLAIRNFSYPVSGDRFTPLSDGAGIIAAVGAGVTRFKVGDRVCSTFFQAWPGGRPNLSALMSALGAGGRGVLADHAVLAETGVAPIPDGWRLEEGASISCAAVTAWSAFKAAGGLVRGDTVLVIGTGGVALFALQIAVAAGADVVILSSSDEKLERARQMGAKTTINYRTHPDWEVAVRAATGGAGVQHAIELGGQGTLAKSLASTAIGSHVALIGALAGFGGEIPAVSLIMGALRVSAIMVGSYEDHLALTRFLVEHDIRPAIDSVFDVGDIEAAYGRAGEGAFGKVVVRL